MRLSLLEIVQQYLDGTGMTASRFGREAVGDPRLVFDLRAGRMPQPHIAARVHGYIAGLPVAAKPRGFWNAESDDRLWAMATAGIPQRQIADQLGCSLTAARTRLGLIRAERAPDLPPGQRLKAAAAWRIRNKPYFDSLYGPDEWATDPDLAPVTKRAA